VSRKVCIPKKNFRRYRAFRSLPFSHSSRKTGEYIAASVTCNGFLESTDAEKENECPMSACATVPIASVSLQLGHLSTYNWKAYALLEEAKQPGTRESQIVSPD
jgi:hypothetical protein